MSGADVLVRNPLTGLLARESTSSQRIIYLLEKYEKNRLLKIEKVKETIQNAVARNQKVFEQIIITLESDEPWATGSIDSKSCKNIYITNVDENKRSFN